MSHSSDGSVEPHFAAVFMNTVAGWEKGSVGNLVGYGRRTSLVPVPEAAILEDLNAQVRAACLQDQERTMAVRAANQHPLVVRYVSPRPEVRRLVV